MATTDRALVRHVTEVFPSLEHLFQAGDDVAALAEHPGWIAVNAILEREADDCLSRLERHASVPSHAEFASLHGRVGGLRAAKRAVVAIDRTAQKAREAQQAKNEAADAAERTA